MPRPHPALVDIAAGRPPSPVTDQGALVASAADHRMGGMLWTEASEGRIELGGEARQAAAALDLVSRRSNERLWVAARTVVPLAADLGVGVAVLKGITVDARWYRRRGERPSSDLDLLLHPAHLHRADDLLAAIQPRHPLAGRTADFFRSGRQQSVEARTADGVSVDIHADALKLGYPAGRDEVWAELASVDGIPCLGPGPSLAHLLVHVTKDRFRYLLGLADVRLLLDAEPDALPDARRVADAAGVRPHVEAALAVIGEELGVATGARPTGWRSAVWRVAWPADVRLQGHVGLTQHRHRQLLLTALAEGPRRQRATWVLRQALPPAELIDYRRPGRGPWPIRLARGRWLDWRRRRAARSRFGGDGQGRLRDRGASPGAG